MNLIRESDAFNNPSVYSPEEELGDFYRSFLSKEKLLSLTNAPDLDNIRFLELKVDSRKTGLGDLGKLVPQLEQLKVNNSFVPLFRDLGSGYMNLKVLWMARCSLKDCEGIGSLRSLRELYLAYNELRDISSLSMLENLEILDLESNDITELEQIEYLGLVGSLQCVTLEGNPLSFEMAVDMDEDKIQEHARQKIVELLPQIKVLDDVPIKKEESVQEALHIQRPTTSYGRPTTPSDLQPLSRPTTAHGSRKPPQSEVSEIAKGIDLPIGGNPIQLLRARRRTSEKTPQPPPMAPAAIKFARRAPGRAARSQENQTVHLPSIRKDVSIVSQVIEPHEPNMSPKAVIVFKRKIKHTMPQEFIELSAHASEGTVGTLGRSH
ncbi:hypothetical protein EDD86DRAFT_199292 [Gorgonomyces haynaldii]|nr:hypothetical protein EDD86DRAFT_199292 [Gorgonomyces haynaldii]